VEAIHIALVLLSCKLFASQSSLGALVQTYVVDELARCWQNMQYIELMKEKGLGLLSMRLWLKTYRSPKRIK
jgi:hypothetical protein